MATIVFTTREGTPGPDLLSPRIIYDSESDTYFIDNVINGRGGDDNIQSIRRPLDLGGQLVNFTVTLTGGVGNDNLSGDNGADVMSGGEGNDAISGGTAAGTTDNMSGGTGVDTLSLSALSMTADFALSFAVQAAGPVVLADGSTISGFEKFVVQSGKGNDTFDMSGDANALDSNFASFKGDDTVIVDSLTQGHIIFQSGPGTDRLIADLSAVTTVVQLTAVGAGGSLTTTGLTVGANDLQVFNVTGGSAADTLTAGSGGDSLAGGGSNDAVDGGGGGDTLSGGNGDDLLLGDVGGDSMSGGGGADKLTGGRGTDLLAGDQGSDLFIFTESADSGVGSGRDRILDFTQGADRIDLRPIDADGNSGNGDQRFAFLGTQGFSGAGGEVRFSQNNGNTILSGDINGDLAADFQIQVDGLFTLTSGPGGDLML